MNPKNLIRDADKVQANLVELDDGRLVTKAGCRIYIPVRFLERGLAFIGIDTSIVGIYAMTVEDKFYAVSLINAMIPIDPSSTLKVVIDGDEYYEFTFDAGSTVIKSVNLVQQDTLTYSIYSEIYAKGRVPWYITYDLIGRVFETAKKHADANLGEYPEIMDLIASIISRDENDRVKYYRQSIVSYDELATKPPAYIPLRSVVYAATNTLNKLAGSYARDGLVSALVSPTTRTERIEALLRR